MAQLGLAILAGAGFVLALPPFSFLPLALASFAILAVLLRHASPILALGLGYLFGLGQFVPGLFWITESFQVDADRFGWIALPAVVGLAGGLSVFPAFACWFAARATRYRLPPAVSLASSWAVSEWLRGHVLTGFPWNLAAYALADWSTPAQAASLVGSYGLGFLLVLGASLAGLSFVFEDRHLARHRIVGAATILIVVAGFGAARLALSDVPAERGTQIRVIQPNIAQSAKWDDDARNTNILRLLLLSARSGPFDLLLWPETAWPGFLEEDQAARAVMSWLLPETGVLLTGSPERQTADDWVYRNSVLAIGPDGTVLTRYAKHHLVPFGEYVPWRSILPFPRLVESLGDFTPGPGPRTLAIGPHPYVGVAICYEAIFPGHVVDDAIRPDWIFNATNDAWFGNSIGPWQHLASARMRAVEEGLPLVRAANTGISAVIDSYGRTRALLDLGTVGIIDARLPRPLAPTLYARIGDWSALVLILLAWVVAGIRRRTPHLGPFGRTSE
ncbi:MAG: apolipoprotein N-acyltransferase [Rhodobacterales bacterium 65-51]|uniref:apolipoprotein N-acyltransferase n=1 Tax=uncultured Gemmobacter sp. TaxID=1095917 RepID=UPI000964FD22|nr:apolipoprotein N-acyltransferase [uncultured Gemmobacter sp.]OJY28860.1 MAG: apolipoprotein N-acyltransferase [Rhodobacterales bacterium 65-51]